MGIKERRLREEGTRLTAILAAAEAVFADRGYHAARMEDIADRAELSKGALYYYFQSKDDIYVHLLERESRRVHEEFMRRIAPAASFLDILEASVDFYLEYFTSNPSYLKIFLPCMAGFIRFENGAGRDAESGGQWVELHEALRERMAREGLPFDLDELLKFLKTLQIGMGLKLLEGQEAEARAAGRFFVDMVKRILEDKS